MTHPADPADQIRAGLGYIKANYGHALDQPAAGLYWLTQVIAAHGAPWAKGTCPDAYPTQTDHGPVQRRQWAWNEAGGAAVIIQWDTVRTTWKPHDRYQFTARAIASSAPGGPEREGFASMQADGELTEGIALAVLRTAQVLDASAPVPAGPVVAGLARCARPGRHAPHQYQRTGSGDNFGTWQCPGRD